MSEDASIEIRVEQLLDLRHIPTPTAKSTPASNDTWLGSFASDKRGHGTDYDDLRRYSPGDDIRHIDWRASARTGELHTRLYREEKEHKTTVICDLRPCMFTGSKVLRANRATTISARLLWQACGAGTRVTLIVITANGISMNAPGSGHVTAIQGCNLLASEHQRIVHELQQRNNDDLPAKQTGFSIHRKPSDAGDVSRRQTLTVAHKAHGPTLDAVLQWLLTQGHHKTTRLWVSGFDYEGEQFFNTLESIPAKSLNIAIHVDDPILSTALPAGEFYYSSHGTTNSRDFTRYGSKQVHSRNQPILEDKLEQIKRTRAARFDALMIPYLSTAHGDDEVIAALRHRAYLA